MIDVNSIADRLRHARSLKGWSQEQLAARAKVSQSTIGNIEAGTRNRPRNLLEIAKALQVREEWLLSGAKPMSTQGERTQTSTQLQISPAEQSGSLMAGGRPESIAIGIFDAGASMGLGRPMPEHDVIVDRMVVSMAWVRSQLPQISSPSNLAILSAYGDSMKPTFVDGDMLLVDMGYKEARLDAVYVFAMNDDLYIKRVQRRPDGALIIKSDNPLYDPHIVENGDRSNIQFLGRVVWAWNGKKL